MEGGSGGFQLKPHMIKVSLTQTHTQSHNVPFSSLKVRDKRSNNGKFVESNGI